MLTMHMFEQISTAFMQAVSMFLSIHKWKTATVFVTNFPQTFLECIAAT